MKKLYFILSFLCFGFTGAAQTAATYGFTALTAPFVSISGTGTSIPSLSDDDFTETSIPIGFSFNYCGASYTDLSVSSNGFISLSNSPTVPAFNSEFLIDGPGWLMPYWFDLDGFLGTAYYETTGSAPNRVMTIEWHDWTPLFTSDLGTFQVRLYETSGVIDFHYGPSSFTFTGATIGISNDNISDWQTLSDEGPSPVPMPSPTFGTSIFFAPADGQIYRWTPPCVLTGSIVGLLTTCPGGTTAFAHDTAGGVWTSGDPSVATIDLSTGEATGISDGTAVITYTSGTGCYTTAIVTVATPAAISGALSICLGLSTTLTHPTSGGTWSSSDPAIADVGGLPGIINGFSLGTATITYELSSGCFVTTDVTVVPAPTSVSGPPTICQGSSATFTGAPAGGTWSSSFSSIASIDPVTGVATGVTGGVTTISYTLPSGCFRIAFLTVNPLPAPIAGGTSICISGTLPLTSTTFGGTWSSSLPAVGTVDGSSGVFTGLTAGTTTVSYILASGCYRTVVVTVTATVASITGDMELCRMEGSFLTSATPGGTWSSSDLAVGTIDAATGLLTSIGAGTTTISYALGSGCFVTAIVTVNPLELIFGVASVCPGSTMTMTNAVSGGTWTSGDISIYTVDPSTGVVTGLTPGAANITYLNPFGCSTTTPVTVHPLPSAITGDLHICVGSTATLSSAPAGGSWSHTPLGAVSIDGVTGVVTGMSVGVSEVTYTILATSCMVVASVTVDAAPAAISGTMVTCPNFTSLLTHPVPGGTWSSSTPAVGSVSGTGVLTGVGLAGGTTTISYTLPTSGCVATAVATVYPAPNPITGSLTVCESATTTLSTTSVGATWTSGNTAVATIGLSSGTVAGITPGTSTIVCHGTNGCTRSVIVTVNPNPAAITGTAVVCVGSTTTLGNTSGGGAWSSSSNPVGTVSAGGGVVGGISAGPVTITYTLVTGCYTTRAVTVNALPAAFSPATNALCVGTTITLNSTPAAGTWSSSNITNAPVGASTGVVSGNVAGTAVISYTHPTNSCVRTRQITVNALPATIGGPTIVCPASTITMTNTTPAGTWSSSTLAVGTIGTSTGVLMGIAGGTTTVTYTLGTGCYHTLDVSVISAPIAALTPIGDTILCPGDFVTLTASAAAGVTYTWYNGGVLMPGVTASTYTTGTAGSYQVQVSVAAGCSTLSVPMSVSVMPATATITVPGGSTSTCTGTPVVLNANTGVGLTYQWSLAGSPIAGATASAYSATTGGNYTVRVTNSAGCWAVSAPVAITVVPAPLNVVTVSGPLTICNGSSVTFTAAAGAGYTYQWHNGTGPIAGATSISYTATAAGSYHAVINNTSGCSTTTAASVVVVNALPNVAITLGGPKVFCTGGVVAMTAAPGFNYQWYRDGAAITGATNGGYVASTGGGYRVRVTNALTGCTDMTHADTVVSVIGTPSVLTLTPAKFCWGGSSLLSTSASSLGGAINYQWTFNAVVIPGATNPTYNATVPGIYACTIAVPSSCTATTGPVTVSQVPLPDPPVTFNGTSMKTGNYYVTYQWYKNLVPIPGATAFSTPATGSGSYKVAVTDTNGCQNMSGSYVLNTPSTGVINVNNTEVRIFPNPANRIVYIESMQPVRAIISGMDGKVLIDIADAKDIDVSKLANGMYLITLFDAENNTVKTGKLVKVSE